MPTNAGTSATIIARVTPWIVAAILLATAVVLYFVFRRYDPEDPRNIADQSRSITQSVKEKFTSPANSIVHEKNGSYIPLLRNFFASSGDHDDYSIMFYPSIVDVACTTMKSAVKSGLSCDEAFLDTVSVQDREGMLSLDSRHICNSMAMSREPMDPRDATLRVLQGRYTLVKTCLRIRYSKLEEKSDSNGDHDGSYKLKVPSKAESTKFMMTNRTLMLCANGTKLYKVTLPDSYDSTVDNTVTITLDDNTDSEVWPSKSGFDSDLGSVYELDPADGSAIMNCTVYYMRYNGPVRIGVSDVNFDELKVVSLCFDMNKSLTVPDDASTTTELIDLGSTADMKVALQYNSEYDEGIVDVKVDIASESFKLEEVDMTDGYVIVVYSTDMLLVYYLSRKGVKFVRKTPSAACNINGSDKSSLTTTVRQKRAAFPVSCFPNDVMGIPNFHDLQRKLVTFS